MLGNDVVDLHDEEARDGATHPRFDARVFTESERASIASSDEPNRLRWSLWAAKEAAYKLGVTHRPGLVFSPRRFVVELEGAGEGRVKTPVGRFDLKLVDAGDAVHAIATEAGAPAPVAGMTRTVGDVDPSRGVRRFAARILAERFGVATSGVEIGRRGRVPTLRLQGDPRRFELSLSHHGRYLAFACAEAAR